MLGVGESKPVGTCDRCRPALLDHPHTVQPAYPPTVHPSLDSYPPHVRPIVPPSTIPVHSQPRIPVRTRAINITLLYALPYVRLTCGPTPNAI